ncbi:outer membrane lipoprotein carrier protein LolA [Chryseomicrobium palamuruense]|uniref:Outer membrane lipoprotein carrier protein LolA n=1 Tax=Chryseomicrobium palamuruense TaxID=682973 RepID=A0ABV8UU98_9BACL
MNQLKKRLLFMMIGAAMVFAACGGSSEEKVRKQIMAKWEEQDGYEVKAEMVVQSPSETATYSIDVWHTKPDYYRVSVNDANPEKNQLIIRNKEGVFVISPHLQKSYQFKSDWPLKHSQAYLIESLSRDIQADPEAEFTEQEKTYTFVTKTKASHEQSLPQQTIEIDKKSLLPKRVVIHSEDGQEKMELTFTKIELGKVHSAADYEADPFEKATDGNETASAEMDDTEFQTSYPTVQLTGVELLEEKTAEGPNGKRVILTYGGTKAFTLIQQPSPKNTLLPVHAPGDPAPIGMQMGGQTEHSLQWEQDGKLYFLASTSLTEDEMLAVAASMQTPSLK